MPLTATTQTQATFAGELGVVYSFRVRATDNVNNASDWVQAEAKTVIVKKYYSIAGQRVAMRENNVVYWLHGDHLGSTSLTTDETGAVVAEQKYLPYGEVRWSSGSLPTDRQFTDQRSEAALGDIYDYRARFYSSRLGRFVSADTIVPGVGSQHLSRYMYVTGNAVRYNDPTGHDPLDKKWEKAFEEQNKRKPTDQDRRDRLFSLIFPGSGPNGDWTDDDWAKYSRHRQEYWEGKRPWKNAANPSLDRFVEHLKRLSSHYKTGEEHLFVQHVGFVWGGIPLKPPLLAAWQMGTNPNSAWAEYPPLHEGTEYWRPQLVDDENPSHHYAGLFYMGYFFGPNIGYITNWVRDGLTGYVKEDILLGDLAVDHGHLLRTRLATIDQIIQLISDECDRRNE